MVGWWLVRPVHVAASRLAVVLGTNIYVSHTNARVFGTIRPPTPQRKDGYYEGLCTWSSSQTSHPKASITMRLSKIVAEVPVPPSVAAPRCCYVSVYLQVSLNRLPDIWKWGSMYDGAHGPLIDLAQGAPSDPPCDLLQDSIIAAAAEPFSAKYSGIRGIEPLRKALVGEMKTVYGTDIDVGSDDIALTAGCNMAFYATIMALAERGDEVILPIPWYDFLLF